MIQYAASGNRRGQKRKYVEINNRLDDHKASQSNQEIASVHFGIEASHFPHVE